MRTPSLSTALAALFWVSAGCTPGADRVEVSPNTIRLTAAGEVASVSVRVLDVNGAALKHGPVTFVSSAPNVVEVRADGTLAAVGAGTAEVKVTCEKLSAMVQVKVSLAAKVALAAKCEGRCTVVTPEPLSLKLDGFGASAKLDARVLDAGGDVLPLEVKFDAADPEMNPGARRLGVEVSRVGELKATSTGRFMVLASAGPAVARVLVEVVLPRVDVVQAPAALWVKPGASGAIEYKTFRRDKKSLAPVEGARIGCTSNALGILKIDDDGKYIAGSEGKAEVTIAADSGAFATVWVTVSAQEPSKKAASKPVAKKKAVAAKAKPKVLKKKR